MPSYKLWLKTFLTDKEEVTTFPGDSNSAVHSNRRYLDKKSNDFWEIALTYTGRLVVRRGEISPDGTSLLWTDWETKHDIQLNEKD